MSEHKGRIAVQEDDTTQDTGRIAVQDDGDTQGEVPITVEDGEDPQKHSLVETAHISYPDNWPPQYYHPARPASEYLGEAEQRKTGGAGNPNDSKSGPQTDGRIFVPEFGEVLDDEHTSGDGRIFVPESAEEPKNEYMFLVWKNGTRPFEIDRAPSTSEAVELLRCVRGEVVGRGQQGSLSTISVMLEGENKTRTFVTEDEDISERFKQSWNVVRAVEGEHS